MVDLKNSAARGTSRSPGLAGAPGIPKGAAKGKPFVPLQVKDGAIFLGWIAGLILIASLAWFFTQPLRSNLLLKSVNKVLEESGDSRRLEEPVPPRSTSTSGFGEWYTVTRTEAHGRQGEFAARGYFSEGTRVLIFTFIGEGAFFPCAAVVSPGGRVEEFIPLNNYGEKVLKQISPGILKIYRQRIEGKKL